MPSKILRDLFVCKLVSESDITSYHISDIGTAKTLHKNWVTNWIFYTNIYLNKTSFVEVYMYSLQRKHKCHFVSSSNNFISTVITLKYQSTKYKRIV